MVLNAKEERHKYAKREGKQDNVILNTGLELQIFSTYCLNLVQWKQKWKICLIDNNIIENKIKNPYIENLKTKEEENKTEKEKERDRETEREEGKVKGRKKKEKERRRENFNSS